MSSSHTPTKTQLHITHKQYDILLFLYRFRFLSRIHIQHFLHHKNHTRIIPWLNSLTNQQLIGRIYSTAFGENTKPAVYYLTPAGRRVLKTDERCNLSALQHVYGEAKRSAQFRAQCLFLADLYFQFLHLTQEHHSTLHFSTQTDLAEIEYLPHPLPDAYIAIEETDGAISRYFLELIDAGTPRFAMRSRIKQYVEYAESQQWETATQHPFPKVMLICPDERTQTFLQKFIATTLEESSADELAFFLTTKAHIRQHGIAADMWQK